MKTKMLKSLVPYTLISLAGAADIITSLVGWSRGLGEVYGSGGSFLWIFYWLILTFAVLHYKGVPVKVKVWFPLVSGACLFIVPALNVVTLLN